LCWSPPESRPPDWWFGPPLAAASSPQAKEYVHPLHNLLYFIAAFYSKIVLQLPLRS
jgi:hypothetical protein